MSNLRTVRFYGHLGRKFGRSFQLAVSSPAEAIAALGAQLPGLQQYLYQSKSKGVEYAVFVGETNITADELAHPSANSTIKFAPVLVGAGGKNGVLQTIVGGLLVIAGAVLTVYGFGNIGVPMTKFGWSMVIGGIAQMLAPQPKGGPDDKADDRASYVFSGPVNTLAQGNPVPVGYGRMYVGSAVVSAGIETRDQGIVPAGSNINNPPSDTPQRSGGGSPDWQRDFTPEQ